MISFTLIFLELNTFFLTLNWVCLGDGRLTRYGVRFTAQVWPGDDLSASATVTAIETVDGTPTAEFSVETKNQDGVVVLSGSAAARLDP